MILTVAPSMINAQITFPMVTLASIDSCELINTNTSSII